MKYKCFQLHNMYFFVSYCNLVLLDEFLHELSNVGAKEQFKSHFVEKLISPTIIKSAQVEKDLFNLNFFWGLCLYIDFFNLFQRGNRECHLVILKDDDVVEWGEFPPNNGEEYAESKISFLVSNNSSCDVIKRLKSFHRHMH